MREFGKIITRKTDLTDAQVQQKYKFPAIIILHDNEDQILKITHYQKNGTKTIYDFSLSASKQFVTDSIATAIAGLQDNRLEFNEFSDFPAIGDVSKFYIDLTQDKIYIWDSYSQTYKNQSWDTATIASIQASIASAQMAFQNLQNSKLDKPTLLSSGNVSKWNSTSNNFVGGSIFNADDGKIGISKTNPTEMFDVGGRTKSDGQVFNETTSAILPKEIKFKDGKFKAALADGVEKTVLLDGDVSGFDFNALVDIFQYSNFQFIRPSFNTTSYFQYANDGGAVYQAGHVAYNNLSTYQIHGIQYKSVTTTVGRCNGNFRGYIEKYSYSSFNTSVQFAITSNVATQRVFVGYSDLWRQPGANPWNAAMNTLTDVIGVCMESGSSNLFIIHNDNSGTANLIDTGFTHSTNYIYILKISKKVNRTTINVVLERIDGAGVKTVFNYDITNNYTPYGGYLAMYCIDALGVTETSIVDFGSLKTKRLNYLT